MKVILILLITGILFGCSKHENKPILPSERIIRFSHDEQTLGYGVRAQNSTIVTATHVIESCKQWNCTFDSKKLHDIQIFTRGDLSILGGEQREGSIEVKTVKVGDSVYILRSHSGIWKRFDSVISSLDASYIGYDRTLSGVYLTGAIEISIGLEAGESGLPVWSQDGELLGVVSASDMMAGKSYVVK